MLKVSGVAGAPGSLFHQPSLDAWLDYYDLTGTTFESDLDALRAVMVAARAKGRGTTDVFGLRMQRGSFAFFMDQLDRLYPGCGSDVERIEAAFGPTRFLYLKRDDKLGQAISRVIAEQTGLWHRASDGTEMERLAPPQQPEYDPAAIAGHLAELNALEAEWEAWFAQEAIAPLRLTYEALSDAPRATLGAVLGSLGLDPALADDVDIPTAKLADETSMQWRERYALEAVA